MKKTLVSLLAAAMMLGCLTACGGTDTPSDTPNNSTPVNTETTTPSQEVKLSGTVNLDGSTSMEKVIKILIESFNETNPDVTINYNASGSGSGITAAIDGTVDMGLSSRELKEEETSAGAVAQHCGTGRRGHHRQP